MYLAILHVFPSTSVMVWICSACSHSFAPIKNWLRMLVIWTERFPDAAIIDCPSWYGFIERIIVSAGTVSLEYRAKYPLWRGVSTLKCLSLLLWFVLFCFCVHHSTISSICCSRCSICTADDLPASTTALVPVRALTLSSSTCSLLLFSSCLFSTLLS